MSEQVTEILTVKQLPKFIKEHFKESLKFNSRMPNRASRAYKAMRETLKEHPTRFLGLNTGIVIANDKYILDGGHTAMALMDALSEGEITPDSVQVKVTKVNNLSDSEMVQRSVGLNTKVTPPLIGEKDLEGAWNQLKKHLSKDFKPLYEFRPGTMPGAPFKVDMLVALLHAWYDVSPERCYSSKGLLVRLYSDDKYEQLIPYINDMIEWYSFIAIELSMDKQVQKMAGYKTGRKMTLPNGEVLDDTVPAGYIWPIYSSYRELLEKTDEPLFENFEKDWAKRKKKHLAALEKSYKDSGRNPTKLGKDKTAYQEQIIAVLR